MLPRIEEGPASIAGGVLKEGALADQQGTATAGEPEVLRQTQYKDSSKLARRANIHKYGRSPIGWFDWVAREAQLPDGADVLEVGCGPGWMWTAEGFSPSLSLTLTDISSGMLEEALPRVSGLGRYRAVAGQVADARTLPFETGRFDAVLACHMLYHVPNPGRALAEMVRVLRPGGVLAVTTNGDDNMGEMYMLAHRAWGAPERDPAGLAFGIDAAAMEMAPLLSGVTVSTFADELQVTDGEDIVATLTSYPPGDEATEAQLATLRAAIAEGMRGDGAFHIRKRQGLVRGIRLE